MDSGYGHAAFLAQMQAQANLVHVVRLKTCNVWTWSPRKTGATDDI
jgi:hypothetical protein